MIDTLVKGFQWDTPVSSNFVPSACTFFFWEMVVLKATLVAEKRGHMTVRSTKGDI
jgi:hypothetical protein